MALILGTQYTNAADILYDTSGDDQVYGFGGDDYIRLSTGTDYVEASTGNDEVHIPGTGLGNKQVFLDSGDDYADLHQLDSGAASIYGGDGLDSIIGGKGNDSLYGDADKDFLSGWDGADLLIGGRGEDSLGGGYGNDTLHGADDNDYLDGGDGADQLRGGRGIDELWGDAANSATTLEQVVDFYRSDVFNASITGAGNGFVINDLQRDQIALFMRILNVLENIRSAIAVLPANNSTELLTAKRDVGDAIKVIKQGTLRAYQLTALPALVSAQRSLVSNPTFARSELERARGLIAH